MNTSPEFKDTTVHSYDSLAYVAKDPLLRDMGQSRRLHEPELMNSSIDPISGCDIEDPEGHPFLVDGNLVIYFESDETRLEYLNTSKHHQVPLPDNPLEDGEAEG